MKAEDTVMDMHNPQIMPEIYYPQQDLLRHQAEISFKAGIKEVVDCEDKVGWYDTSCGKRVFCVPEDYRNGKLKEWDIK